MGCCMQDCMCAAAHRLHSLHGQVSCTPQQRCTTPHSTHRDHRPTAPNSVLPLLLLLPRRARCANTQNSHAEATCALHIHEKAVGGLDQPLELVLGPLQLSWRVEQINIAVEHLQTKTAADQHLICVAAPAKRCKDTAPGRHAGHSPTACCWCHQMLLQRGAAMWQHAAPRTGCVLAVRSIPAYMQPANAGAGPRLLACRTAATPQNEQPRRLHSPSCAT